MALSNADVAAACVTARADWASMAKGSRVPGWANTLDDLGAHALSTYLPCVNDAAQRESVAAGFAFEHTKTPESFFIASLRLATSAVAGATTDDTTRLTRAALPLSSGLTDTEIKAACDAARSFWDSARTGGMAGGRWYSTLDLVGLRVPTTLAPCVNDAARRVNAVANQAMDDPQRTLDVFVTGALKLSIQAVSNPSADELTRLAHAGL